MPDPSSASYGSSSEMSSEMLVLSSSSLLSSISSGSSLSSAALECDPFDIDPRGREGIGVVQPQSGVDYPFINPSEDVRYLLADFYLEYAGDFQLPFRIRYLHGFGCLPGVPPGIPPHALTGVPYNVVVLDSASRIVFDSRDSFSFRDIPWGPRNHIYEWRHAERVCRLVTHTMWSPDGDPPPRQYYHHIVPESAVLDDRTLLHLPQRVTSLHVVLDTIAKSRVELCDGYNMEITVEDLPTVDGGRVRHQIRFDAIPGKGQGIFPGCTPPPLTITKINSVAPSDAGDFFLSATDCFFFRQPTSVTATTSRPTATQSPWDGDEGALPDPLAGTTTTARGWPAAKQFAHLQFGNDCQACCDCDDYVAVARYMNRTRDDYKQVGNMVMAARGIYHDNRQRFLAAARCMQRRPLRIFLQPQICPFLDVALQYSNQTDQCLTDLDLTVDMSASPNDVAAEVPGFTLITGAATKPGRRKGLTERYSMGGSWPTFTAHWDAVEPYASVSVRFRLEFPDCFTPYVVTGNLTGTLGGDPIEVLAADSGSAGSASSAGVEEAVATDTKTLNCPASPDDVKDGLRCYLEFLSSSEFAAEN